MVTIHGPVINTGRAVPPPRKLLFIGLDCAAPDLVFDRLAHRLPVVSALRAKGLSGILESTVPPITVPAWACMFSGRDPGELGIYGFRNRADHTYSSLRVASSLAIKEAQVWNVLGDAGKRVILVGVPQTYPPSQVNGLMVSGFPVPGADAEFTYPRGLQAEVRRAVGDYEFDVKGFRGGDPLELAGQARSMAEKRFRLMTRLLQDHPWDFAAIVEIGLDRIHHGFWNYFDPEHRLYTPDERLAGVIPDYYGLLDGLIGELLQAVPPDTAVMIASDHGAKRMDGGICINEWLIRHGYLTLKSHPEGIAALKPEDVVWSQTKAWGEGGYYARIFLNVAGREPEGVIASDDYENVRIDLIQRLEALGDEKGRPIGTRVLRPEGLYRRLEGVPPDLIALWGNLYWRSIGSVGHPSVHVLENDTGPDAANHAMEGMYILAIHNGPVGRRDASIYDVAPTLGRFYGLDWPEDPIGRTLID